MDVRKVDCVQGDGSFATHGRSHLVTALKKTKQTVEVVIELLRTKCDTDEEIIAMAIAMSVVLARRQRKEDVFVEIVTHALEDLQKRLEEDYLCQRDDTKEGQDGC